MGALGLSGWGEMMHKYRILITGTSSGFGKLTAETLASAGHCVFAGMRDPSGKNAAASADLIAKGNGHGGSLEVVNLDVTSDAYVDAAVAFVDGRAGGLDILINNAGIAGMGMIESFTVEQARAIFEVNVLGVHRMNRAVLPLMRREKSGLLVHVSSTFGRFVVPFLATYVSSKFALEALAEGYRYELAPSGIESVIVEPGSYPTKITANMLAPADPGRANAYPEQQPRVAGLLGMFAAVANNPNAPNPQDVADAILRLVEMAPGTRPLRTAVDAQANPLLEGLNRLTDQIQAQAFGGMGMSDLLTTKVTHQ